MLLTYDGRSDSVESILRRSSKLEVLAVFVSNVLISASILLAPLLVLLLCTFTLRDTVVSFAVESGCLLIDVDCEPPEEGSQSDHPSPLSPALTRRVPLTAPRRTPWRRR